MKVIDYHAHIVVPEVLDFTYETSLFAQAVPRRRADGTPEPLPPAQMAALTDPATRLRAMDAMGIDIQVLSPSLVHQCTYALPDAQALALEQLTNDRVAETVARHPDRLAGIGSVPLQNIDMAVRELERAVRDLGLKGIVISSHANGAEIGEPSMLPFWQKVSDLGTAVMIHPAGGTDPRLKKHRRLTSIGQQMEEAFAVSSLMFEGVLDRFPDLRIAVSHGGGFLPYYAGRLDEFWRKGFFPGLAGDLSAYLKRLHYDSVVFNPDVLENLAAKVTPARIMMGTDYPFGENDPVGFIRRAGQLSREEQDAVLGSNAARFLGIAI